MVSARKTQRCMRKHHAGENRKSGPTGAARVPVVYVSSLLLGKHVGLFEQINKRTRKPESLNAGLLMKL